MSDCVGRLVQPDNIFVRFHITPTIQRAIKLTLCDRCGSPEAMRANINPFRRCSIHQAQVATSTGEVTDFYKLPTTRELLLHHATLSGGWVKILQFILLITDREIRGRFVLSQTSSLTTLVSSLRCA